MLNLALETIEMPADAVEVGRIGDAWGIKGWVKVIAYSASPEALFSSKRWFIEPATRGETFFAGTQLLRISETKEHSGNIVAKAKEIDDRTSAESLKNARIFVPRSSFPSLAKDEFYWVDLLGLEVENREGILLGIVTELLPAGPQTTLVIERQETTHGSETNELQTLQCLIPFVERYIDNVDIVNKKIKVDWQLDY